MPEARHAEGSFCMPIRDLASIRHPRPQDRTGDGVQGGCQQRDRDRPWADDGLCPFGRRIVFKDRQHTTPDADRAPSPNVRDYGEPDGEREQQETDRKEAEDREKAARLWINGLEAVHEKLKPADGPACIRLVERRPG
jgi:hypothetical protein